MTCPVCGIETPGAAPCVRCTPPAPEPPAGLSSAATGTLAPGVAAEILFAPGTTFGARYTIVEAVGSGGMGRVYKAIDRQVNRTVALKLIRPDLVEHEDTLTRFRHELALGQQVTHGNVCRVHDMGEVERVPYISMEFVQGQTLADLIRSVGRLSPAQTVALGSQICAGLAAVHAKAIVHRDLKPSNVMVDRQGHAVLMDFGVARGPEQEKLTAAGAVAGTLQYAPPEHLRTGTMDARGDLYATGLILYEMLTGRRPPGDGGPLPLALRERSERCPPPSHFAADVPHALDAIVMRCLERAPDKRFASAEELGTKLSELDAAATGTLRFTATDVLSSVVLEPMRATWRRRPWVGLAVAAAVVALLALGLARVFRGRSAGAAASGKTTLALLPLAYEGPQDTTYLRHMLPVVLSERLRGVSGLDVAPYASSRAFEPNEDAASVTQALGVRWVLKGRLHLEDTRATAELALVRADAREPVWQRQLTGDAARLADQASAAAEDLAKALGVSVADRGRAVDKEAMDHYVRGLAFLESWDTQRNLTRAEGELKQALEHEPRFAAASAALAKALWTEFGNTKDPSLVDAALGAAKRGVELDESLAETHLALGVVLLGRGHAPEAMAEFTRAQQLAPADDAVCRRVAQAHAALGQFDQADVLFQRAIDLRPGFWQNYNSKGALALQRGQPKAAVLLFERMTQLQPGVFSGWNNLGNSFLLAGQPDKALPCFETALRLRPVSYVQSNIGVALYLSGQNDRAAEAFRAAMAADTERPDILRNLGDALRHAGKKSDAVVAYSRASEMAQRLLRVNPNDRDATATLAVSAAGTGECRRSREVITDLLKARPDDAWAQYNAAVALALCGQRSEAHTLASRAAAHGLEGYVRKDPDLR
jgi:eukaryotic-like serine/threonine-protein kinase